MSKPKRNLSDYKMAILGIVFIIIALIIAKLINFF
jgi:hypothetical protein